MMSGSDTFSMISELSRLKALLEFKVFEIDRAITTLSVVYTRLESEQKPKGDRP